MNIYILDYFATTEKLLKRYEYFLLWDEFPGKEEKVRSISEVLKRIKQLDYLFSCIREINTEAAQLQHQFRIKEKEWQESEDYKKDPNASLPPEMDQLWHKWIATIEEPFILELHLEQFYYVAHRIKKVVEYLPGLKNFDAAGIRDVRNRIIEHPEKKNGFTAFGFTYADLTKGPKIITYNKEYKEENVDNGFFHNAEEFKLNLEKILRDYTKEQDRLFRIKNNIKG